VLNKTIEYSGPIELMDDDWETVDIVEVSDELIRFDELEYASHGAGPAMYPYWICTRLESDEQCIVWPSDIPDWYFETGKLYPNVETIKGAISDERMESLTMLDDFLWRYAA
jgi:hypothetical protein